MKEVAQASRTCNGRWLLLCAQALFDIALAAEEVITSLAPRGANRFAIPDYNLRTVIYEFQNDRSASINDFSSDSAKLFQRC